MERASRLRGGKVRSMQQSILCLRHALVTSKRRLAGSRKGLWTHAGAMPPLKLL